MIRDETVFVMGEEVARYNGAYKVSLPIWAHRSSTARLSSGHGRICIPSWLNRTTALISPDHKRLDGQIRRGPCY